jgi:uncharacterized membrane protein
MDVMRLKNRLRDLEIDGRNRPHDLAPPNCGCPNSTRVDGNPGAGGGAVHNAKTGREVRAGRVRSCSRYLTAALSCRLYRPTAISNDGRSFMHGGGWSSVFGPRVVGTVAAVGVVAAGAAIVEAALVPGLLIGGAAVLAPRLLPRDMLSALGDRLRRTASSLMPAPPTPRAHSAQAPAPSDSPSFNTWHAVAKTITYRVMVTTVDFGANYFVIGELATAAGLSTLSLVAGPIAYFAHEAAWHYYGPVSSRHPNPLEAKVHVPLPSATQREENGQSRFASVNVSRALAKTVTYEVVTGVSEFSANYLVVRDLAAAAGLTAVSIVIAPFVYYAHEKAWDYYDATKARSQAAMKLLPAA